MKRDEVTPVTFSALPGAHVPMCKACNGQLNRFIEDPAKPVVRALLTWSSDQVSGPTISPDESAALARWFLKIGVLAGHPDAVHDNPHVQRDADFPRFDLVEPEWLAWMRSASAPPDDFSVYVTRRSVTGEQPWREERQLIFLPRRILVGTRELHYVASSFGVRGLDVTIVWHPDWPILHPLDESHRLAVLWPHPTAIDFEALPEVHPREFAFVPGLGTSTMTVAEFEEATKTPLSVDNDPIAQFLGSLDSGG